MAQPLSKILLNEYKEYIEIKNIKPMLYSTI